MEYIALATSAIKLALALIAQFPKWVVGFKVSSLEKERKKLQDAKDACGWTTFLK